MFHISYNKYISTFKIWKEHSWEMAKVGGREGEPSTDSASPFSPCAGWKWQNQVAGRSSSSLPPAARSPHRLCFSRFSSARGGPLVLPSSLLQKSPASVLLVHLPSLNNEPSLLSCLPFIPISKPFSSTRGFPEFAQLLYSTALEQCMILCKLIRLSVNRFSYKMGIIRVPVWRSCCDDWMS